MSNIKYITNAGSYILPNGIIVLVNEDIEAYLNGTLLYQETLDDEDIYIDNNLKFRDNDVETRIVGNKIFFDMIDGSDKYMI